MPLHQAGTNRPAPAGGRGSEDAEPKGSALPPNPRPPVGNPWSRVRESNPLAPRYERGVRPAPRGEIQLLLEPLEGLEPSLALYQSAVRPFTPERHASEAGLPSRSRRRSLERETGLEPVSRTRQVRALPLSYTRSIRFLSPRSGNRPPGEARAVLRKPSGLPSAISRRAIYDPHLELNSTPSALSEAHFHPRAEQKKPSWVGPRKALAKRRRCKLFLGRGPSQGLAIPVRILRTLGSRTWFYQADPGAECDRHKSARGGFMAG